MLRKSVSVLTLMLLMLVTAPWFASAEEKTPHEIIQLTSIEVLTSLKNDANAIKDNPNKINELVDEIILPICDLERMGKYILAKHWKTATEEQREAFVTEFKQC